MIKLLHCADIHLGSPLAGLPADMREERRRELRATFGRMADYASEGGFAGILICGDAFDSDRPLKKDKEYFYNIVKLHPSLDFFYLRGNHDVGQSYTESLPNLKTFGTEWSYYTYGDVVVAGIELCESNRLSMYSTLRLNPAKTNIVMLHGQLSRGHGDEDIDISKLRCRNIDYLALGHIHSFKSGRLDERGVYAYSGCPEGRGYDECGAKGFVALQAGRTVYSAFVPFAARTVHDVCVDISTCADWLSAARAAKSACPPSSKDMVRVTLKGEACFDCPSLAADVQKELEPHYRGVSVKDETRRRIDLSALAADPTLRGRFVREVMDAEGYTEPERRMIIDAGLRALEGREEEL